MTNKILKANSDLLRLKIFRIKGILNKKEQIDNIFIKTDKQLEPALRKRNKDGEEILKILSEYQDFLTDQIRKK